MLKKRIDELENIIDESEIMCPELGVTHRELAALLQEIDGKDTGLPSHANKIGDYTKIPDPVLVSGGAGVSGAHE